MRDYSKAKIFKITNTMDNIVYVSYTIGKISQRMAGLRQCAIMQPNQPYYKHIRLNVGWDNCKWYLLENYYASNLDELTTRVQYWKDKLESEGYFDVCRRTHHPKIKYTKNELLEDKPQVEVKEKLKVKSKQEDIKVDEPKNKNIEIVCDKITINFS